MNENPDIHEVMRRRRVNALLADAQFLTSRPDSQERAEAIEREVRRVMVKYALREISEDERQVLFNLLSEKGTRDEPR
jgi:hypothetical protein